MVECHLPFKGGSLIVKLDDLYFVLSVLNEAAYCHPKLLLRTIREAHGIHKPICLISIDLLFLCFFSFQGLSIHKLARIGLYYFLPGFLCTGCILISH